MEDIKNLITALENAFANFLSSQTEGDKVQHQTAVLEHIASLKNATQPPVSPNVEAGETSPATGAGEETAQSGITNSAS